MENQIPIEKQPNQIEKKEWVSPEIGEINVNSGAGYGPEASVATS